jgi:N-acetylglucosamine-6-phosphate deacetylase
VKLGVDAALVGDWFVDGDVRVEDGHVVEVGIGSGAGTGLVAAPGFVDLQVNGFGGVDFRTATVDELLDTSTRLAATGVTAFLPTFFSTTIDGYVAALRTLADAQEAQEGRGAAGAWIAGAHLEGPFLSRTWAGAHDPARLLDPDPVALHRLLGAGPISMMTLAPELPGAGEVIARLANAGVVVAMGHTDADAAQAHAAADAGVTVLTHCWNAHRRFSPRDPGPAPVAIGRMHVGLICDRVHVADDTLRMTIAAAPDRVCVVTDAIAPAGTDATAWDVDGVPVAIADGRATLADGTLAGSVATMDASVRNLLALDVPIEVVLAAASHNPAAAIGVGDHVLRAGASADLVLLDEAHEVVRVLVDGTVVHER